MRTPRIALSKLLPHNFRSHNPKLLQLSPWPHSFRIRFCCNLGELSLGRFPDFGKKASDSTILGVAAIYRRVTLCVSIVLRCVLTFIADTSGVERILYFISIFYPSLGLGVWVVWGFSIFVKIKLILTSGVFAHCGRSLWRMRR